MSQKDVVYNNKVDRLRYNVLTIVHIKRTKSTYAPAIHGESIIHSALRSAPTKPLSGVKRALTSKRIVTPRECKIN